MVKIIRQALLVELQLAESLERGPHGDERIAESHAHVAEHR